MAEVRKRTVPNGSGSKDSPSTTPSGRAKTESNGIKATDILRILGGLLLLNCAISYFVTSYSITWGWRPWFSKQRMVKAWINGPLRLTDDQLSLYNGTDASLPVYLALNGTIYDVSAGRHVYGPGGSYSFFAGRDATRAFITGCFAEDLTPDLRGAEWTYVPKEDEEADRGLGKAELKTRRERDLRLARKKVKDGIEGWATMFRGDGGKNYFKVGEVVREEGWLEKLPPRELCERARNTRPKRNKKV